MDENIQNTSIIFVVYPISYLLCSKIVWLFIGMGFHKNTLRRIDLVCDIVRKHYEPGRRDRCYKEVWRRYVNPVYSMCYRTFLNYIGTNTELERRRNAEAQLQLF
ncbi:hypothetical protein [Parabacteroides merdae]|mgnify:FL=1|jgi:hypothetical protein|nr:hypothetical protein [Parabacteroides merdae]DAY51111.1 MAG TPA: hypothetical protein [Caudoviricetes sp.]